MVRLQNYVLDAWQEGTAPFRPLVDPATEEPVAETSTRGLDFAAVLEHARTVGGPTLRAMTFAERGALLKAMSKALYAKREELIRVAQRNGGNTRGDAKFDVDGATGTLSYYAYLGKSLGDAKHLVEEDPVKLAQGARFCGTHVAVPRRGAAVHVNAFNFPAWGTFEKAACALLAGMPVVTKPATSTSWLTYEMTKVLVEAEVLPAGTFQLIAGSAGDLLDHLGGQDVLAFTGSADTGALLRGGDGPVKASTRVNVEADSLNAMVVGPDVQHDDDLWRTAVRSVAKEMTQKTGQKCTAIRRVFVPSALVASFAEDLGAELDRLVVGNPADSTVTMGPLTTASQLRDYREGVRKLAAQATLAYGSPVEVSPVGAPEGKGYYAAPIVLTVDDARAATDVHDHEVFGPVVTLLAYDGSADDAVDLVALGGGSLVTTVLSDDRAFLKAAGLGIAAWNGRVLLLDTKVADQATPHGMVLPQLVHGGPGRAGGGEELGAERGLGFYLQRTALQGNRGLLEKLFR